jgi:hypothetical protein
VSLTACPMRCRGDARAKWHWRVTPRPRCRGDHDNDYQLVSTEEAGPIQDVDASGNSHHGSSMCGTIRFTHMTPQQTCSNKMRRGTTCGTGKSAQAHDNGRHGSTCMAGKTTNARDHGDMAPHAGSASQREHTTIGDMAAHAWLGRQRTHATTGNTADHDGSMGVCCAG